MSDSLEIFIDGEVRSNHLRVGEIIFDSAADRMGKQGQWFSDDPDRSLLLRAERAEEDAEKWEIRALKAEEKLYDFRENVKRKDVSDRGKVALLKDILGLR